MNHFINSSLSQKEQLPWMLFFPAWISYSSAQMSEFAFCVKKFIFITIQWKIWHNCDIVFWEFFHCNQGIELTLSASRWYGWSNHHDQDFLPSSKCILLPLFHTIMLHHAQWLETNGHILAHLCCCICACVYHPSQCQVQQYTCVSINEQDRKIQY